MQFLFLMMRYVMNETLSFLITVLRPSIVIIYHMYVVYVYESVSPLQLTLVEKRRNKVLNFFQ